VRNVSPTVAWAALAALALAVAGVAFPQIAERLSGPAPATTVLARPLTGAWLSYVAPEGACAGGDDAVAAPAEQQRAMLCLVNYARLRRGLVPVTPAGELATSAALKARDIARCGRFAHDPCGPGAALAFRRARYAAGFSRAAEGENIALMPAEAASPRLILNAWLNSPDHRGNIFRTDWREQGIALVPDATVDGQTRVNVWVSHFGYRVR
jgi:uncharacterized protein YkwD